MTWNASLITSHLLDFLFELEKNGLSTPLTIAGGFGLFLKRQYLIERKERMLFDGIRSRSTEDIDVFVPIGVLCDKQQTQSIVNTLHLGYEVIDAGKFFQWKKPIELGTQIGYVIIDFLVGNVESHRELLHIKDFRARNPHVEGFHAHITLEAVLVDEKALDIPLKGKRSSGDEYETTVRIPHPFTYLIMKLFAFRDRQNDPNRQLGSHHAFDIFSIIGSLTERELKEVVEFGKDYANEPIVQEAKQIVQNCFTGTSPTGMVAIKSHSLFQNFGSEHYGEFIKILSEIF
jgi:hypothetical protein